MSKSQNHFGLVWVNEKHNVLFLHIPKNATCSIRDLGRNENNQVGTRVFNKSNLTSIKLDKYFKFTVLRNPYERFKSGYLTAMSLTPAYHDWLDDEKFKSIVEKLKKGVLVDVHINPQKFYIKNLKIDKFIQLENLEEGLKYVSEKTGLLSLEEVQHYNKAGYLNPKFGPESKEKLELLIQKLNYEKIINEIYREDWLLYNKEFIKPS